MSRSTFQSLARTSTGRESTVLGVYESCDSKDLLSCPRSVVELAITVSTTLIRESSAQSSPECSTYPPVSPSNRKHDYLSYPSDQDEASKTLDDHLDTTCFECRRSTPPCERHRLDEREGWTMIPGRGWSRPSGKPLPFGTPRWQACACGVGMDQMEERMRRSEMEEQDQRGRVEEKERAEGRYSIYAS
jgi:hypothetical protein